jgi:ribonuclease-3
MSEYSEPSASDPKRLELCEQILGYTFVDRRLLQAALRHASLAGSRLDSNERLEFLGDAFLGLVTCEHLYTAFPQRSEGELTELKSKIVSRAACARMTRRLGLNRFMQLGKGVKRGNSLPDSLLANVFESVVAAIYLDSGFAAAREFVVRQVDAELAETIAGENERNFKSEFQEYCQKVHGSSPTYQLLAARGPDHNKQFSVAAILGTRQFTPAWGGNKKSAQQRAAGNALAELTGAPLPFDESEK